MLLWVVSHIALGYACFYLGYFLMVLLALFSFPLMQTLLLIIRFPTEKASYWLLIYLPTFVAAALIDSVNLIILLGFSVLFIEFVLFLMTKKFGRFTFTVIGMIGLGTLFMYNQSYFNTSLDFEAGYFFFLLLSSSFLGLGIEAHK